MTDAKWVLILGAIETLVGLILSSYPIVVELGPNALRASVPFQTQVAGLIVLAIGAALLVAAITINRR
jgi:hypothetical protein